MINPWYPGFGLVKIRAFIFALFYILSLTICFGQVEGAPASDHVRWHATLNGEFRAGDSRDISRLGFTFPVSQTADSLMFLDFRGQIDDADNEEYNVGFVFRRLQADDCILGLYSFFDHKQTGFDNDFNQVTFGAELLGEKWDLRANGYIPITGVQNAGLAPGYGLAFVNDQLFLNSQTLQESAYHGVDFEVGRLLSVFGENDNELRVYGGGFYFDSRESGFEEITGPRARLEMRLFDVNLLGEGSRVTVSGEVQYDDVREAQAYAGFGVQIPLGRFGSDSRFRSPGVSRYYGSMSRMERRMLDPVIRDVDIVTNTKVSGDAAELMNDAEGDPLFLADANYDIGTAIQKAGANGTVVVSGSVNTPGNNQLLNGQRITSVTKVQTVTGSVSRTKITSSLPGTQGVINGTDSTQAILLLADNVMIDSLHINGGANGIATGGSVSGVTIDNNIISRAIQGAVFTGNGIFVGGTFEGIVSNNIVQNNENDGIKIITNDGAIESNTTSLNGDEGIDIEFNNGTISLNTANSNGDNGISMDNNAGDVFGNTAIGNDEFGISMETNEGFITGNTMNQNGDSGYFAVFSSGTISGNTTNMNGTAGIVVFENAGVLTDNISSGNEEGYFVFDNSGLIAGNSATGNVFGFSIDRNLGFGLISDNTASSNLNFGFGNLVNPETINDGFFTDNISTNNGGAGYHVMNSFGGISIGNTSTGNGAVNTGGAVP